MEIKVLDEKLINKIAAGEVIERPASVVKELIENSIDAGATSISVEVKNFGKGMIKVMDNGNGMSEDDARLCILRHATSKINDENDLFNINTLGFRGEALASIAAVSHMFITTCKKGAMKGYMVEVEGGKLVRDESVAPRGGTIVEVRDLFFNVPARLKFLKSDTNELRNIIDIVTRYALINTDKTIKLVHNGHSLVSSPASLTMIDNISSVYGLEVAKQLMEVEYSNEYVKINGYVSKPSLLKSEKSMQSFYVNGRYVKDDTIQQALYDAYHTLLFVNKHPVVVLDINIDAKKIDVNVHPTKDKIKFDNPTKVYDAVFDAVRNTLKNNSLITDFSDIEENVQLSFEKPKPKEKSLGNEMKKSYFDNDVSEQKTIVVKEEKKEKVKLPEMKVLCQIMKTFFIAETEDGVMLIDQHVVQERVLYEKFMKQYMNKEIKQQQLLSSKIVELPPKEAEYLRQNVDVVKLYGYDVEHFGENSFKINAVPMVFNKVQNGLMELVAELANNEKLSIENMQEDIITRMACRASVKAGDEVTVAQMNKLLDELDKCTLPYTCPHGRPIFIKLTYDDLDKMFRRKA
ncbi:DNA mismatch repair endonuclease MutL [Candidatus Woesearchaeota archaeon]|nr:MAG: DNA mismatch repair endonuclease MutL [Candidatus Woesearchaeota archaeon]